MRLTPSASCSLVTKCDQSPNSGGTGWWWENTPVIRQAIDAKKSEVTQAMKKAFLGELHLFCWLGVWVCALVCALIVFVFVIECESLHERDVL